MKRFDSMRGWFAYELYQQMKENKDIWLVVGDLGYKMLDSIRDDFPERFVNVGAAEQTMVGVAIGLAEMGKIPFVYTTTTFLLYRPFETIRNYINREEIPVRLVGSGRDREYGSDGPTHWSEDAEEVVNLFGNIKQHWPETKEEIPQLLKTVIKDNSPCFISLKR